MRRKGGFRSDAAAPSRLALHKRSVVFASITEDGTAHPDVVGIDLFACTQDAPHAPPAPPVPPPPGSGRITLPRTHTIRSESSQSNCSDAGEIGGTLFAARSESLLDWTLRHPRDIQESWMSFFRSMPGLPA